jgi:Tol biopolymer transport system component
MQTKILSFLLVTLFIGCAENVDERLKYLKQQPPSMTPEIFAPNFISKETESEFGSVFTKDGTAFYYAVDIYGKSEIRYTELEGTKWSNPETILFHEEYGYNDPFLSPDGNRLYFISNRALDGIGDRVNHDIWYVEKNHNEWSAPINAGAAINSKYNEYYMSFTKDGTMYFSSNVHASEEKKRYDFDIYYSKNINGVFQKAIALGDSINTFGYEADVFVDPDESYMIFSADRRDGMGQGDLYISFRNSDGTWSKSKNMNWPINTEMHELCPFVSKDGKYFFYTSNQDIYLLDAKIIERYRNDKRK